LIILQFGEEFQNF